MAINTITSDDTFTLNGQVISDLADGDVSTITFSNDIVSMKTGKNRNTIFSKNETGNNAAIVLRALRGSPDDRRLQALESAQQRDFASFELLNGQFIKRLGDGQGNVVRDVYTLTGGVIMRKVDTKESVEGDNEAGASVYNMMFASVIRSIE